MQNIHSAAQMKIAIQEVELRHAIEVELIKKELFILVENLKPATIIKKALSEVASSPYLMDNLLGTTTGLITGYLSKMIAVGSSDSPFRKVLGAILQFGVTNVVAQHPEMIKSAGQYIFNFIMHRSQKPTINYD